jgi:hypothetical protein
MYFDSMDFSWYVIIFTRQCSTHFFKAAENFYNFNSNSEVFPGLGLGEDIMPWPTTAGLLS